MLVLQVAWHHRLGLHRCYPWRGLPGIGEMEGSCDAERCLVDGSRLALLLVPVSWRCLGFRGVGFLVAFLVGDAGVWVDGSCDGAGVGNAGHAGRSVWVRSLTSVFRHHRSSVLRLGLSASNTGRDLPSWGAVRVVILGRVWACRSVCWACPCWVWRGWCWYCCGRGVGASCCVLGRWWGVGIGGRKDGSMP